jgi:hypothetical protein
MPNLTVPRPAQDTKSAALTGLPAPTRSPGTGEGPGAPCAALRAAFRALVVFFLRAISVTPFSSPGGIFLMPGFCVFWTTIALRAP